MADNKRAGLILTMGVLLLAAAIIYLYMVYWTSTSTHFQNQNYNEFACKYMRENQEGMSFSEQAWWTAGKTLKSSPFETALGVTSCGLVLPTATNNTGNITALLRNYSQDACAYGNNNTFKEFVWVRSLPVNITDGGDIGYNRIAPSGPPGMNPCYLIWRINDSSLSREEIIQKYNHKSVSLVESELKNGTIKSNIPTQIRIDYFSILTSSGNLEDGGFWDVCRVLCERVGFIEIWGMPQ